MARKAEWAGFAPAAIHALENQPDRPFVDRKTLESLLHVSARRAQQLMDVIGPVKVGNSHMCGREEALRYLRTVAAEEMAAEAEQRKKVARTLDRLDREHRAEPPLLVTPVPKSVAREIERRGLNDLPEGIVFRPGEIAVQFADGVQAIERFKQLLIVIASNEQAFMDWAGSTKGAA